MCNSLLSARAYNWVKQELEIMLKLFETMDTPKSQPEVTDFHHEGIIIENKMQSYKKTLKQ